MSRWWARLTPLIALLIALVVAGCSGTETAPHSSATAPVPSTAGASNPSSLESVNESALPAEAQHVVDLIRAGGPYPYERDDIRFGNYEGHLPARPGGYYREYTVPTPGERTRGARRIISGQESEKYYTDDHYETFRFIQEGR